MKKFFCLTVLLMMICATTNAMQLELYEQPIGKIIFDNGGFQFEGATQINGKQIGKDTYSNGVALFGDKQYPHSAEYLKHYSHTVDTFQADKLYFHFDAAKKNATFGDRDSKNSVAIDIHGGREIYVIYNSAGSDFFMLKEDIGTGDGVKIIGLKGGKWIEYLDALNLRQKYNIGWNFHMAKVLTEDNKIIFRYTLNDHTIDVICRWHGGNQEFYTEAVEQ